MEIIFLGVVCFVFGAAGVLYEREKWAKATGYKRADKFKK